jgi:UPF0755 protein
LQVALINKPKQRNLVTIFIVLALLLVTIIVQRIIFSQGNSDYPKGVAGPDVRIVVSKGESGTAIAQDLASQHVVVKASTLIKKLIARNVVGIAPGIHLIQSVIPSDEAIAQLLDQKRIIDSIYVLPGSTQSDILKELHLVTSLTQGDSLASITPFYPNPSNSLEGQLAPVQYSFQPGTSTHDALVNMVKTFGEEVSATKLGLGYGKYTPYQVLTIASLLQIESDPKDYGKVARVIYNRLALGMPLQLNSTVQYALGLRGQIGLSIKATKVDSPYNTYLHTGLPPTPIANPSLQAINGALTPENGEWLYFITVSPHDTRFTSSFSTFEGWVALYNHNVAAGAFK